MVLLVCAEATVNIKRRGKWSAEDQPLRAAWAAADAGRARTGQSIGLL
jgi:hypothetical protein